MKRVGNVASNKIYNTQNKKPPIPIDADEADSAMERFIRAKYIQSNSPVNGSTRHRAGSTDSEGTPPPLPPKTGSKFFKSASTFPLSFRSKKSDSQRNPREARPQSPSDLRNKPSKVFGTSVDQDSIDTAQKLTQLRDMGFTDDKRITMILKGVNGNLEKTIETLVRLGEGGGGSGAGPSATSRENSLPTSRSLSPAPITPTTTAGLSRVSPPASRSSATSNPWDVPPAQPQSSQSTGTLQNKNPFFSTNPFGVPAQQTELALNQSFQNMSLSPLAQQSLFPHHTGGNPISQLAQQAVYQQSMNQPMAQGQHYENYAPISFNSNQTYPQPIQQHPQQGYNPFLQTPAAQQPLSVNITNQGNSYGNNPFTRSPTRIASPTLNQIPEQSQQNFYSSPLSPPYGNNPFFAANPQVQQQPVQSFEPTFYQPQQQQQQQQQLPLQPQRHDKASIMALYNYPSLAPAPIQQVQDQSAVKPGANQAVAHPIPQRSVSTPLPGNKNPFVSGAAVATSSSPAAGSPFSVTSNPVGSGSARSRESMTLGMELAWNNGRHSPDAFASLSARGG